MDYKATVEAAIEQLDAVATGERFVKLLQHQTMQVEYFSPKEKDKQQPHKQDELYIIISGSGTLIRNGERLNCKPHDVLFVPAGLAHHFEDFTEDFATWVVFYGIEGGEASNVSIH
jgi:mannose-6-phosphate isomerase-like protein (cupin superfamily)